MEKITQSNAAIAQQSASASEELKSQATREGWSLLGMAMQFQLAHPGVCTITVGMKTRRQVEENVAALNEQHAYDWAAISRTLDGAA